MRAPGGLPAAAISAPKLDSLSEDLVYRWIERDRRGMPADARRCQRDHDKDAEQNLTHGSPLSAQRPLLTPVAPHRVAFERVLSCRGLPAEAKRPRCWVAWGRSPLRLEWLLRREPRRDGSLSRS